MESSGAARTPVNEDRRGILKSSGWWHSFELPNGRRIEGFCTIEGLRKRLDAHPIPRDLCGARVLDIGAWDGWYSFEMERRGADVVAVDCWDNPRFHEIRSILRSRVDYRRMNVYDLNPEAIGRFDIVLFMGVLYHLKHPLLGLERVCSVTSGMAVIDSFVLTDGHLSGETKGRSLLEFYETTEFGGQADNWCAPTLACLMAMCRTAGFARVEHRATMIDGACISCYRSWQPVANTDSPAPELLGAFHTKDYGFNFDSSQDEYVSGIFRGVNGEPTLERVKPQVGAYGVRGIHLAQLDSGAWQINFKLPPGLEPGWHDITLRVDDGPPSNAKRIAVDPGHAVASGKLETEVFDWGSPDVPVPVEEEQKPAESERTPAVIHAPAVRQGEYKSAKVALFTPLPPSQTGTADYAADLIAELEKVVDLQVFDRVPRSFKPDSFDSIVYQIGNNPFHAPMYELALKHPGTVVLHEVNLHDLIRNVSKGEPAYIREVIFEIFGQELESLRGRVIEAGAQPRNFTMLRRLLDRSRACIVHSHYAADQVRRLAFPGRIACIPHGSRVRKVDGSSYRAGIRVGPEDPLIGIFGYQRPDKLACDCLLAFRDLLASVPNAKLVVVGLPHPEVPLEARAKALGIESSVSVCGFQPLGHLDGYIAACDVVLNLRSPTFGETSGIMARALGMGKTVVASANGANQEVPDEVCAKIPVDRYQNRVLTETLAWLLSDPSITVEIGRTAQEWVAATCNWERVAHSYADFLFPSEKSRASAHPSERSRDPDFLRSYLLGWGESKLNGSGDMPVHLDRLVRMLRMTPRGNEYQRILGMGSSLQIAPALREFWGYGEVRGCDLGLGECEARELRDRVGRRFEYLVDLFNPETDLFPYPADYFQAVLCCHLLESLRHDPMHVMREIHRVLRTDGLLLLTMSNTVSVEAPGTNGQNRYPHPNRRNAPVRDSNRSREFTTAEIARLLSDSGFVLQQMETDLSKSSQDGFLIAVGRKAAIPKSRYPVWLYDE